MTNIVFSNFHAFPNNITITKNSKKYQICAKLYQKKDIIKLLQTPQNPQLLNRSEQLNSEKKKIKNLSLGSSRKNFVFSDLFFNKNSNNYKRLTNNQFVILTPKLIANYVANQIKKKRVLNHPQFMVNLNIGILNFSHILLKQFQKNIIGLKIICSGKWKKTRSGRKQKLTVKFGQIVNSKIANTLLYDYQSQTTKYGVIGIKI